MNTQEALAVLGLPSGAGLTDVRDAYRRLVRQHHPDLTGGAGSAQTARLTEAYALLRGVAERSPAGTVDLDTARPTARTPPPPPPPRSAYDDAVELERAAGDTLLFHAPAADAFAALFEAAGSIGHVAYFDRQLGILETIVRFEGGPSCSFLITLQGRAHGTEAFCTLESIEAAPTPPIAIVMDALVGELAATA